MDTKTGSSSMDSSHQQISASLQSMAASFSNLTTQLTRSCSTETSSPRDTTLIRRTGHRATCSPPVTIPPLPLSNITFNTNTTIINNSHSISKRQQAINRFITCARRPRSTCLRTIGSPRATSLTHRPMNESSTQSTTSTSLGAPRVVP